MTNNDHGFKYTYSSTEHDEIKMIREKYIQKEDDSLIKLKKMDERVTEKATIVSLCYGVTGTLIMGFGFSLILSDLGKMIGLNQLMSMIMGIVLGLVGIVLIVLAYPIYNRTLEKERKKIAPQMIKLSDELLNER